jgi:hypothetical protein
VTGSRHSHLPRKPGATPRFPCKPASTTTRAERGGTLGWQSCSSAGSILGIDIQFTWTSASPVTEGRGYDEGFHSITLGSGCRRSIFHKRRFFPPDPSPRTRKKICICIEFVTTPCPFRCAIHSVRVMATPSVRCGSLIETIRVPFGISWYSPKCRICLQKWHIRQAVCERSQTENQRRSHV